MAGKNVVENIVNTVVNTVVAVYKKATGLFKKGVEDKYKDEDIAILTVKPKGKAYNAKLPSGIVSLDRENRGGLNRSGPVLISGTSGSGKTTLVEQILAYNVGKDYFEPKIGKTGRPEIDEYGRKLGEWKTHHALVIQGEADAGDIAETVFRQMAGHRVEVDPTPDGYDRYYVPEEVHDRILAQVSEDMRQIIVPAYVKNAWTYLQEKLIWYAENSNFDIYVFDNYTTIVNVTMARDERTSKMSEYDRQNELASWLEWFCLKYNVWVIAIAHYRKANSSSGNQMERTSGSLKTSDMAGMVLNFEEDGNQRVIKVVKNRLFNKNLEGYRTEYDEKSQRIFEAGDTEFLRKDFPWVKMERDAIANLNNDNFFEMVTEASNVIMGGRNE